MTIEEFGELLNELHFSTQKDQYTETFRLVKAVEWRERERCAKLVEEHQCPSYPDDCRVQLAAEIRGYIEKA